MDLDGFSHRFGIGSLGRTHGGMEFFPLDRRRNHDRCVISAYSANGCDLWLQNRCGSRNIKHHRLGNCLIRTDPNRICNVSEMA